jgi:hypothetical protein
MITVIRHSAAVARRQVAAVGAVTTIDTAHAVSVSYTQLVLALMHRTLRRAATVIAATTAFTSLGVGGAQAHELYSALYDGSVVVQLSNQQTYTGGLSSVEATAVCNTDSEGPGFGLLFDVQPHRDWDLTACSDVVHTCTKAIPHEYGYMVAERAGITLYTDSAGTSRFHCWTFPKEFVASTTWVPPLAPPTPPRTEADPRFVVYDHSVSSVGPRLSSTIELPRVPLPFECVVNFAPTECTTSIRVSGSWFVESSGRQAATQLLTYYDWDGELQSSWLRVTPGGDYLFVTFRRTRESMGAKILAPDYCLKARVCHLTNVLRYLGADGHRYTSGLEVPKPATGGPVQTSAARVGSPVGLDAHDFAPGNGRGLLTYRWRFTRTWKWMGFTAPVTGHTASYSWSAPGTYDVELTVNDELGHQAVTTMQVDVE